MKKKHLDYVLLIVILLLGGLLVYQLWETNISLGYYLTFAWVTILATLTWLGNRFIARQLEKKFPWVIYSIKRLWIQLVLSIIYALFCVNFSFMLFRLVFTESSPDLTQFYVINIYGILITLPFISTNLAVYFLKAWRESYVQSERFQKETIRSQLEALRNHLDPHFLFNNLNILSSLIDKDKVLAKSYLDCLADVYRYVLKHRESELVELNTELEFVSSYVFLLKIRFGENLNVNFDIDDALKILFLPPLALQLLIENATKHNMIDDDKPLCITIKTEKEAICVSNNLQLKISHGYSSKIGLKNIKRRYAYLSQQEVTISKTDETFSVSLPLLEIETL